MFGKVDLKMGTIVKRFKTEQEEQEKHMELTNYKWNETQ